MCQGVRMPTGARPGVSLVDAFTGPGSGVSATGATVPSSWVDPGLEFEIDY